MWNGEIALFRDLMGTGLIIIWYLLSLVYLFVLEKRQELRIIFIYVPIILLFLYFNPLFAQVVYSVIGDEIYYRILWLLPVTVVIAYVCVSIYGELSGIRKELFALVAVGLIVISGSFIYNSPFFHKAENLYHVPDSVVHICDAIEIPDVEVKAVFPVELLSYVRQYSPTILMPYGRDVLMGDYDEMYEIMESDEIDLEQLLSLTRQRECQFIVFRENAEFVGDLTGWDLELFLETDGYTVYRDNAVPFVLPQTP